MDRLTEMEAFATVIDQGGFADAARKNGHLPVLCIQKRLKP